MIDHEKRYFKIHIFIIKGKSLIKVLIKDEKSKGTNYIIESMNSRLKKITDDFLLSKAIKSRVKLLHI
jgi:hypothetical protein